MKKKRSIMTSVSDIWLKFWDEVMVALYGGNDHSPSEIVRRIMVKYDIKPHERHKNKNSKGKESSAKGKFY